MQNADLYLSRVFPLKYVCVCLGGHIQRFQIPGTMLKDVALPREWIFQNGR